MIPGEIDAAPGEITINEGRRTVSLTVENTGDRPVQVGSHYHFFEVNDALRHTGVELDTTPIHPRTVLSALEGGL